MRKNARQSTQIFCKNRAYPRQKNGRNSATYKARILAQNLRRRAAAKRRFGENARERRLDWDVSGCDKDANCFQMRSPFADRARRPTGRQAAIAWMSIRGAPQPTAGRRPWDHRIAFERRWPSRASSRLSRLSRKRHFFSALRSMADGGACGHESAPVSGAAGRFHTVECCA